MSDGRYGTRPIWGIAPEFATITMGGYDIGILNLILTCIYSLKLWGNDCDQTIQAGHDTLASDNFKSKMHEVIQKAVTKGRGTRVGPEFKFFVTGYAQFFNQKTTQCNKVSFKRPNNSLAPQNLTIERRTKMNELALSLNAALKAGVAQFPTDQGVVYVDYDAQFEGHRFCDRVEPNAQDPETWFFAWDTKDDPEVEQLSGKLPAYTSTISNDSKPSGTFKTDSEYINALLDAAGDDPKLRGYISDTVRVFHPKPAGHQAIRGALLKAIDAAGIPEPGIPAYVPEWCGMHIVQYQKNENSGPNAHNGEYMINVSLFDGD